MKRVGNLYEKIYDMDNIRLAHKNARKGKRHYSEVKKVDKNPEFYRFFIFEGYVKIESEEKLAGIFN